MEKFKKIGDIYDKKTTGDFYETVGKDAEEKAETDAEKLLDDLIPQILDGKIVLDLGCGNGKHSEVFCKRGAEKVIAVDLSESMLEQARVRKKEKQLNQLELIRADMNNLSVGKDKFDFIFSRFSLMYSENMNQLIKDLSNSLSDDGEFLAEINVATIQDQENQASVKKEAIPLILTIGDKKVELMNYAYSKEEYMQAFEDMGLKVQVFEQFPTDEITIDESYPDRDQINFSYAIFKVKKEKEDKE